MNDEKSTKTFDKYPSEINLVNGKIGCFGKERNLIISYVSVTFSQLSQKSLLSAPFWRTHSSRKIVSKMEARKLKNFRFF